MMASIDLASVDLNCHLSSGKQVYNTLISNTKQ